VPARMLLARSDPGHTRGAGNRQAGRLDRIAGNASTTTIRATADATCCGDISSEQLQPSAAGRPAGSGASIGSSEPAVIRYLVRRHAQPAHPGAAPDGAIAMARPPRRSGRHAKRAQDPGRDRARQRPPEGEGEGAADRGFGADCGVLGRPGSAAAGGLRGGFRRGELVDIEAKHLTWDTRGIAIALARSKTDQTGEGVLKAISYRAEPCSPAKALRTWRDSAGVTSGSVFRSITKWGVMGAVGLNPASMNTILAGAAQLARLGYMPELSSDSLRRGVLIQFDTLRPSMKFLL
jgi:hypothetical protein